MCSLLLDSYCMQAMRNAAGLTHVAVMESNFVRTGGGFSEGDLERESEDRNSNDAEKLVIAQEAVSISQDTEELVVSQDTDELMMSQDTEKLVVSQDGPTRPLYRSSSKCCKSKASIIISRSVFLAVGMAVLLVGVVLASTVRPHHNFTSDENCTNCSLMMCDELTPDNMTLPIFPSQTTMSIKITPLSTPASRTPFNERTSIPVLSPSPTTYN